MTFDEAFKAYGEQHEYVIDVRGPLVSLRRGNETIGKYHTFAEALAAFMELVQGKEKRK